MALTESWLSAKPIPPARGSGLIGLAERVDALGGKVKVASPVGERTPLLVTLPIEDG
jgi:signal transduction histidine kinase